MVKYYEAYLAAVNTNGPEELTKPANKNKLIEAYNTLAGNYAKTDKAKAREYFGKTIALDPTNAYALEGLKTLK